MFKEKSYVFNIVFICFSLLISNDILCSQQEPDYLTDVDSWEHQYTLSLCRPGSWRNDHFFIKRVIDVLVADGKAMSNDDLKARIIEINKVCYQNHNNFQSEMEKWEKDARRMESRRKILIASTAASTVITALSLRELLSSDTKKLPAACVCAGSVATLLTGYLAHRSEEERKNLLSNSDPYGNGIKPRKVIERCYPITKHQQSIIFRLAKYLNSDQDEQKVSGSDANILRDFFPKRCTDVKIPSNMDDMQNASLIFHKKDQR